MSQPTPGEPAKLICGVLCSDRAQWPDIARTLETYFGPIECRTDWWPFSFTSYYEKEMGSPIWRCYLAFEELVRPEWLPDFKLKTNTLEEHIRSYHPRHRRLVNLDPGLLTHQHLILASCKPAGYRIYLRDGVYAELELWFRNGRFEPLPWTYPDYRAPDTLRFFLNLRKRYLEQRRQWLKKYGKPPCG